MVEGLVFVAAVVGFEVLAARFGKSTRDGEDWEITREHLPLAV